MRQALQGSLLRKDVVNHGPIRACPERVYPERSRREGSLRAQRGNLMNPLGMMNGTTPVQIASVDPFGRSFAKTTIIMSINVIASAAKQSHEATCYHERNYTLADCLSRS